MSLLLSYTKIITFGQSCFIYTFIYYHFTLWTILKANLRYHFTHKEFSVYL